MWISLLMLLLLLVTPISCRAEIRQEHGTRFRIFLRIWGIPMRFDHSQAPMRPKPPSAQQLQKGKALLRALPKLKRPVRLLMRQTALEQLLVHVSLALRDPAATALTTAFLVANPGHKLEAAAAAVCMMGLAGEIAWANMQPGDGNSTYRSRIIDAIFNMTGDTLEEGAKYELR